MENYKFTSLLGATGLTIEEKYNLSTIFASLTPSRQMHIIDYWGGYLDRILQIQQKAEWERTREIQEAFSRINQLIDDAYLRDQEAQRLAQADSIKKQNEMIIAMDYDQRRRLRLIREEERSHELARERLANPLDFI